MSDRSEGSIIDRLAYTIGYALGRADSLVGEEPDAPAPPDTAPSSTYTEGASMDHESSPGPILGIALGTLGAGLVLSRLIKPRPVNWPRAILAGTAATALADLVQSLTTSAPEEKPEVHFPPDLTDLPRYAAGIATAAAYGSQIYPRLPGSPLTRGLIFGTAEAALADGGGALGLLQQVAPQIDLPYASLASYVSPRRTPLASLAFGLGLGLYSSRPSRR